MIGVGYAGMPFESQSMIDRVLLEMKSHHYEGIGQSKHLFEKAGDVSKIASGTAAERSPAPSLPTKASTAWRNVRGRI
jgi:hypothetical protein